MKNLFTCFAVLLVCLSMYNEVLAQATYWEHTFTDDVDIIGGGFSTSPRPVVTTDRAGNIISAFYQHTDGSPIYLQIEKFSATGTFLGVNTIDEIGTSDNLKIVTDNSGNIYLLATVAFEGSDGTDIYFAKFRPNLTIAWEQHLYSDEIVGIGTYDKAGDLLINTKAGTELYISYLLKNYDGQRVLVDRFSTSGELLDRASTDGAPSDRYFSNPLLKQATDGRIYCYFKEYISSEFAYQFNVMRFPDGSPAFTTNLSAMEEFTLDLGDEDIDFNDEFEVDNNGILYFIVAGDPHPYYNPLKEGVGVCAVSPETGMIWNTLDLPASSGLAEKIKRIKLDRTSTHGLYAAGISGGYPNYNLIITALDRATGEVYSYNLVDTTWIDFTFGIRSYDYSAEAYIDGLELNVELQGLPLELIVSQDEVYLESFGWYKYLGAPNPIYSINKFSKNLNKCTTIDAVPVTPNPVAFEGGVCYYTGISNYYHPYNDNSNLQYSPVTGQLNFIYTSRYNIVDGGGMFGCLYNYDFFAEVIQRSYTGAFRLADENSVGESEISFYPNPASQFINIQTSNENEYQLDIIDIAGKKVLSETFNGNYTGNVAQMAKGMYMVFVKSDNEIIWSDKLIIQ